MNIERGTAQDLPAVLVLLAEYQLPPEGLAGHAESLLPLGVRGAAGSRVQPLHSMSFKGEGV